MRRWYFGWSDRADLQSVFSRGNTPIRHSVTTRRASDIRCCLQLLELEEENKKGHKTPREMWDFYARTSTVLRRGRYKYENVFSFAFGVWRSDKADINNTIISGPLSLSLYFLSPGSWVTQNILRWIADPFISLAAFQKLSEDSGTWWCKPWQAEMAAVRIPTGMWMCECGIWRGLNSSVFSSHRERGRSRCDELAPLLFSQPQSLSLSVAEFSSPSYRPIRHPQIFLDTTAPSCLKLTPSIFTGLVV